MTEPELLLAHRDFVRALAADIVRDVATVDDVAQETLLAAWQRGDATHSWRGYLATVARNFARQFLRGERRRQEREQSAASPERTPSVADVVAREEQRRRVVAAVLGLAEPYRGAVLLRFYEGLAPREIAERLAVPAETARTRVKRGVELVRARLLADEKGRPRELLAWLVPLARPIAAPLSVATPAAAVAAGLVVAAIAWTAFREDGWARAARGGAGGGAVGAAALEHPDRAGGKSKDGLDATRDADRAAPTSASAAADAAAAVATWRLAGRVVDARDAPVPGARVFAWPDVVEEPIEIAPPSAASNGVPKRADRAQTTSDVAGRFELSMDAALDRCTVVATSEGHSPGTVLSVSPDTEVTIVLEDDDLLVGTVTDTHHQPIEGAHLHAWGMHGGALFGADAAAQADGSYRMSFPVADRAAWQGDSESWIWWVEAKAESYAPRVVVRMRDLDPDHAAGETRCDFVLRRGARITGSVVDGETGTPVADARVVLVAFEQWMSISRHLGGRLDNPLGKRVVREARSDEAGLFALEHAPALAEGAGAKARANEGRPQFMQVFVLAPGYAPTFRSAPELGDEAGSDLRVEVWRSATIVGRVVDADGNALVGVRVSAHESISGEERSAGRIERMRAQVPPCVGAELPERVVTGADGRYEITGIPATGAGARWWLGLDDYSWEGLVSDDRPGGAIRIDVHAGAVTAAPDLVGVPNRSILLEVIDEVGRPVAGARVHREPSSFDERNTDAAGRLRWIEPDFVTMQSDGTVEHFGSIRLRIARRGFATTVTEPIQLPKSESHTAPEVKVVLARAHVVRGLVVDVAQRPAPRASVTAWRHAPPPTPSAPNSSAESKRADAVAELPLASGATDGEGRFVLDDLPDGPVFLEVHPPVGWKDPRRGGHATFADVGVDGPPVTLRLADE